MLDQKGLEMLKHEDNLFHYTKSSTAIEHILPKRQLRLGTFKNFTDPREKSVYEIIAFGSGTNDIMKDYHVILNDVNRRFLKYLQYEDINGRYIIKNLIGNNLNLESQYVMTHFSLPCPQHKQDGDF